jgi:hypothetical protein
MDDERYMYLRLGTMKTVSISGLSLVLVRARESSYSKSETALIPLIMMLQERDFA